ncbi:MAG: cytoplasmic protein [Deltaproteobacteria bacterium]|nr:cytoplasmic protein [Deltaproteobacteria bacterium]
MNFDDEHERRKAAFSEAIRAAHGHSSHHRAELLASATCGCFYCCATFAPGEIDEWTDEVDDEGQTALCPRCGVDAVLGDRSGYPLSPEFLREMHRRWF